MQTYVIAHFKTLVKDYLQHNMLLTAKFVIFLCSVISQGKAVALNSWDGKWNHISMTHRLTTDSAKDYCNRALIVQVILENVVTFFLGYSVVDQMLFRFAFCRLIPEIFAIKVESCQKSRRILDVFTLPNFVGAALPNVVPKLSRRPPGTSPGKVSWGSQTNPKVIGVNIISQILNVRP